MAVKLTWLNHATILLDGSARVIIDPWKVTDAAEADVVVVSHSHHDHLSVDDVKRDAAAEAAIIAPADCQSQLAGLGTFSVLKPGTRLEVKGVTVEGVPAYNVQKQFHPKSRNWCGVVITLDGKRFYYAGDTDLVPEMRDLGDIDVALLPVGGTYTMDAEEAATATEWIKPRMIAIPYHWGDIVGSVDDAKRFAQAASCEVTVLSPGQSTEIA